MHAASMTVLPGKNHPMVPNFIPRRHEQAATHPAQAVTTSAQAATHSSAGRHPASSSVPEPSGQRAGQSAA